VKNDSSNGRGRRPEKRGARDRSRSGERAKKVRDFPEEEVSEGVGKRREKSAWGRGRLWRCQRRKTISGTKTSRQIVAWKIGAKGRGEVTLWGEKVEEKEKGNISAGEH